MMKSWRLLVVRINLAADGVDGTDDDTDGWLGDDYVDWGLGDGD